MIGVIGVMVAHRFPSQFVDRLSDELEVALTEESPVLRSTGDMIQSTAQLLDTGAEILATHPDAPNLGNLGTGNFSGWTVSMATAKSDYESEMNAATIATMVCGAVSAVLCVLLVWLTCRLAGTHSHMRRMAASTRSRTFTLSDAHAEAHSLDDDDSGEAQAVKPTDVGLELVVTSLRCVSYHSHSPGTARNRRCREPFAPGGACRSHRGAAAP